MHSGDSRNYDIEKIKRVKCSSTRGRGGQIEPCDKLLTACLQISDLTHMKETPAASLCDLISVAQLHEVVAVYSFAQIGSRLCVA